MFDKAKVMFLHALTSLHPGSGSEIGLVDLPVQREKITGFPKIESSSLKGALRSTFAASCQDERLVERIFGPELEKESSNASAKARSNAYAGAVSFTDARLLFFPIRSMKGIFAWVTCPFIISRFNEEMEAYGKIMENLDSLRLPAAPENAVASERLVIRSGNNQNIVLNEYTFNVNVNKECLELAKKVASWLFGTEDRKFTDRVVVVGDDAFASLVANGTEVNARIKIDPETGTVADKALWYEELVPPETIFYSVCFAGKERGKETDKLMDSETVLEQITDASNLPEVFQLGGDSTVGRGFVRRIWV